MSSFLSRLSDAVAGKSVPVPLPVWCRPSVPDIEEVVEVKARDASSSWAGFVRYTDAGGIVTERRIVCRSISGYGCAETVTAWCCERKANRTFRIDRIAELVCLETGEVIEPTEHFEQLRLHGALKVSDKSLNDLGRVLVFMSRCDGSLHPLEADAIEELLERYLLRFGGDDRMLSSAMANIGKITPDGDDFVASLGRFEKHPQARQLSRLVLDGIGKVSYADGKLHGQEIEWSDLAGEYLRGLAA